jgi:serine protease
VARVERIGIHAVYADPNDPYFQDSPNPNFLFDQWHSWDTHGVHADQAWDTQTGDASVVVAILDTGVRYFHADLGGNSAPWGPARRHC